MNLNNNDAISKRLFELRTFSDYSTLEMANMLNIDEQEYKDYENDTKEMPINLIYKFANLLDTEAAYVLSGIMPTNDAVSVVYDGKGASVKRYEGYSFTSLASDFKCKTMNPMLVVIDPTDSPELVKHGGQEFNFVVEGELRVIVADKEYFLREGDSIYFDPTFPHAQLAMGGKPAKFLTVINEHNEKN
ncbi:MAG: XRE family transcriptional regulator [Clostridia bacterium]|nr:XRE family transcriptional regulator [Clostridia bacterium]